MSRRVEALCPDCDTRYVFSQATGHYECDGVQNGQCDGLAPRDVYLEHNERVVSNDGILTVEIDD